MSLGTFQANLEQIKDEEVKAKEAIENAKKEKKRKEELRKKEEEKELEDYEAQLKQEVAQKKEEIESKKDELKALEDEERKDIERIKEIVKEKKTTIIDFIIKNVINVDLTLPDVVQKGKTIKPAKKKSKK